jgi:hypothetical protein
MKREKHATTLLVAAMAALQALSGEPDQFLPATAAAQEPIRIGRGETGN